MQVWFKCDANRSADAPDEPCESPMAEVLVPLVQVHGIANLTVSQTVLPPGWKRVRASQYVVCPKCAAEIESRPDVAQGITDGPGLP